MDPHTEHSGDLSSKFENFEHSPADHVWRRVQIEVEGDARPGALAGHLGTYTHAPNPQVWDRIANEVSPLRRRAVYFWWAATAASVALLLFVGWQFGAKKAVPPSSTNANWSAHSPIDSSAGGKADGSNAGSLNATTGSQGRNLLAGDKTNSATTNRSLQEQGLSALLFASVDDGAEYQTPNKKWQPREGTPLRRKLLWATGHQLSQDEIVLLPVDAQPESADSLELQRWADVLRREKENDRTVVYTADLNSSFSQSASITKSFSENTDAGHDPTIGLGVTSQSDGFSVNRGTLDEDFSTPIMIGMQLRRSLSRRMSLGLGPVYTQMNSTRVINRSASSIQQYKRRQYLGVALTGNYEFLQKRRFSAYVATGLQFDFGLELRNRTVTTGADDTVSDITERSSLGQAALANIGLGTDFHLTQQIGLYLQGSLRSTFYSNHANLWTQKLLWPGLQVGLRLNL